MGSSSPPELVSYEWDEESGEALLEWYRPDTGQTNFERTTQRRWWTSPEERRKLRY
jgi:hypothetical protein